MADGASLFKINFTGLILSFLVGGRPADADAPRLPVDGLEAAECAENVCDVCKSSATSRLLCLREIFSRGTFSSVEAAGAEATLSNESPEFESFSESLKEGTFSVDRPTSSHSVAAGWLTKQTGAEHAYLWA